MAVTELTLITLAVLASVLSLGLLINVDVETRIILGAVGSVVWGVVGLSAFDVLIPATGETPEQLTIDPFVYVGFGMAMITGMFTLMALLSAVGSKTGATEGESLMR